MVTGAQEVVVSLEEEQQFARRLQQKELDGVFTKTIRIPEGNAALLFVEEKFDSVLTPGTHQIGNALFGKRKSLVLVNTSEVEMTLTLNRLLSKDPLYVYFDARARVKLQSGREHLFLGNFMRESDVILLGDLKTFLYPEVREAAQGLIEKYTVKELADNLELKQEFGMEMESHLRRTFETQGLAFATVRTASFRCEARDKATGALTEAALQVTEQEAQLEGRKRLFEITTETELQALIEETEKVALFEKRAEIWQRMRHATNIDKMAQVRTEREMEDFLQQVDRDKVLKESDLVEFKKDLVASGQDKERLRAHLARIAELKREQELRALDLAQRSDLSKQQLEAELGLQRLEVETKLQTELKRVDLELEHQRREADFKRAQEAADSAAVRERELAEARKQAEVQGVAREVQRLAAEQSLLLQEKRQATERMHQAEQNRMGWEQQERQLDLELRRELEDHRRTLDDLRERHKMELEHMGSLGGLSIQTLIAVSDTSKAPLLADLAKTEALKGMSPEQILAMAASNAPQLGNALAEMTAKAGSQREREMYERLLSEQKEAGSRTREDYRGFTDTMRQMFDKALETQRDVASAFARGGGQQPQAAPAGGMPPLAQGMPQAQLAAPSEVVLCRHCFQKSPVGTKHCPNCGVSLMAAE